MVRTRFAPSPTGFLHIGGARTALFAWAFAKKHNGKFILRIEDTDLARSTSASIDSILQAMQWLGLDYDEGPYYQTKRMANYTAIIQQLLDQNKAYYCYCSKDDLEQMRETQKQQGIMPKYDRRCLHNPPSNPSNPPVVRFLNPDEGSVIWQDLIKGEIAIQNSQLDDFIIARSDGIPTYNLCVVVDDTDMQIDHVIRGDDHINNTPKQINLIKALNYQIPLYAHVPMILRADGAKMSKRTDAVSVMDYQAMGILPKALLNYLARLCWSHQDAELFSLEQFIEWFNLDKISGSPARFDLKKLYWVNAWHIKNSSHEELSPLVVEILTKKAVKINPLPKLNELIDNLKPRCDSLIKLADECSYFYQPLNISSEDYVLYLATNQELIKQFYESLVSIDSWQIDIIKQCIKDFCTNNNIKMPQIAMPIRLKLCGSINAPSLDKMLALLGKEISLHRISS